MDNHMQVNKLLKRILYWHIKIFMNIVVFLVIILCGSIVGLYVFFLIGKSPMRDAAIIVSIVVGVISCRTFARSATLVNRFHVEYIDILVNFFIFLVVLYRNLVAVSPIMTIVWMPSLEHINSSFLIYIAYTRIEKAIADYKSKISKKCFEEFNTSNCNKYYRHLNQNEIGDTMTCKHCGRLPSMVKYKDIRSNVMYVLEHWCPKTRSMISSRTQSSRYDAMIEWNKLSLRYTISNEHKL